MNPEYVYCLKNDEMSHICKCGGTADSPYNRCDQLSNTSLPVKCEVAYFIEVSDWKKAEKFVHDKLNDLGIKRFKGREWFKCKPGDIKHVFDECKKLYGINNGDVLESNNKVKCNKVNNNVKSKSFYCKICDYTTYERTAYYHHKKSKKHDLCSKKIDINEYNKIKKENEELKKELTSLKTQLLEKEIEILKLKH